MSTRICLDCEQPGDYAQVHADGTMDGWRCGWCDYRLRLRQMGWRRRLKRRVARVLRW